MKQISISVHLVPFAGKILLKPGWNQHIMISLGTTALLAALTEVFEFFLQRPVVWSVACSWTEHPFVLGLLPQYATRFHKMPISVHGMNRFFELRLTFYVQKLHCELRNRGNFIFDLRIHFHETVSQHDGVMNVLSHQRTRSLHFRRDRGHNLSLKLFFFWISRNRNMYVFTMVESLL